MSAGLSLKPIAEGAGEQRVGGGLLRMAGGLWPPAWIERPARSQAPHDQTGVCEWAGLSIHGAERAMVRLQAHTSREVEVLSRHTLSGL